MNRLKENLDYTFTWKDLIIADKLMKKYINDRRNMFDELFNSTDDFEKQDLADYIEYFMGNASDMDVDAKKSTHHKNLYNLLHFLGRKYEFSLLPNYTDLTNSIVCCLSYFGLLVDDMTDEDISAFIDNEVETITLLEDSWNEYIETLAHYPLMHLENMKKTNVMDSTIYYDKNTDKFVLDSFLEFLQNVKKDFPDLIKRFDRFLILDNDYLTFLADNDDKTQAFFVDDAIFLKCHCDVKDESEKFFYKTVLYHEFGHYVFEQLPEYLQLYWQENYVDWKKKGLKMCRDEDKNSQLDVYMNELHSDCFACHYLGKDMTDEDYIHLPNQQIMDTFEFLMKKAFGK